ncbi:MAG: type II toxin-antitoxin system Phd/YefM family antitoxin [Verrucomicrobiota bacterium]|nr:type II toxin-antitoxin system Phd/YefM family antitoxin [Verrucomicrobiota bacterium]
MSEIQTISITDVKRNWGTVIKLVQNGSVFHVTVRRKPKARLVPPTKIKKSQKAGQRVFKNSK